MNFLLCVSNHVSRIFRNFVLYSVIVSIINWNILGSMYDINFDKKQEKNSNPTQTTRAHYCKYMGDFALQADCKLWSCWESQLRDHSRIEFLNIYNHFRSSVARQECHQCKYIEDIPAMIQLEWHWKLEKESQNAIKHCPNQDFKTNLKMNIDDDSLNEKNSLQCEMTATSFPILSGTQDELIRMLPSLLHGNHLQDFNINNKYRRNLAVYIGCSYIPRVLDWEQMHSPNPSLKQPMGHLLCYYCSREKTIDSGPNNPIKCPPYTTKTNTNDFPILCKLTTNRTTLPCESTIIPCSPWKKTYSWIYPHLTNMMAELDNGTNLPVSDLDMINFLPLSEENTTDDNISKPKRIQITPYVVHLDPYDKKFCILLFLIFIIILLLLVCAILLIFHHYLVHKRRESVIMASM